MIFGRQRKLDPHRRFGSKEFRSKVKRSRQYRRTYVRDRTSFIKRLLGTVFSNKRLLRYFLVLGAFVVFYYLVISPYFLVDNISVEGNDQVGKDQITEVVLSLSKKRTWLIPSNHLLLMTSSRLSELISGRIILIKEVTEVRRTWPDTIELAVIERRPGFVMQVKDRNFLVDEDGVFVKDLEGQEENLLLVINQADEDVVAGEVLSDPKLGAFIVSMYRSWPKKVSSGVNLVKISSKETQEVQFESVEGWSAFFDVNRSVQSQLGNLSLILGRQITQEQRTSLAYIDLRLEKWVYYCFINTPCSSEPLEDIEPESEEE